MVTAGERARCLQDAADRVPRSTGSGLRTGDVRRCSAESGTSTSWDDSSSDEIIGLVQAQVAYSSRRRFEPQERASAKNSARFSTNAVGMPSGCHAIRLLNTSPGSSCPRHREMFNASGLMTQYSPTRSRR